MSFNTAEHPSHPSQSMKDYSPVIFPLNKKNKSKKTVLEMARFKIIFNMRF